MAEERGSREAGCAGRATGQAVVLRERKRRTCSEKGQDNIKYWSKDIQRVVTQRPTNKENIDLILNHLTRDALKKCDIHVSLT